MIAWLRNRFFPPRIYRLQVASVVLEHKMSFSMAMKLISSSKPYLRGFFKIIGPQGEVIYTDIRS